MIDRASVVELRIVSKVDGCDGRYLSAAVASFCETAVWADAKPCPFPTLEHAHTRLSRRARVREAGCDVRGRSGGAGYGGGRRAGTCAGVPAAHRLI